MPARFAADAEIVGFGIVAPSYDSVMPAVGATILVTESFVAPDESLSFNVTVSGLPFAPA